MAYGITSPSNFGWLGILPFIEEEEVSDVRNLDEAPSGRIVSLHVFPNPAVSTINILARGLGNVRSMQIIDAYGNRVPVRFTASGNGVVGADLEKLSSGTYNLVVITETLTGIARIVLLK